MAKEVYIVDGIRTAIGNFGGTLAPVRADDLGALVMKELRITSYNVCYTKLLRMASVPSEPTIN